MRRGFLCVLVSSTMKTAKSNDLAVFSLIFSNIQGPANASFPPFSVKRTSLGSHPSYTH